MQIQHGLSARKAADGIGKRLQEWITLAKQAGLGTEDIREMLEGLL